MTPCSPLAPAGPGLPCDEDQYRCWAAEALLLSRAQMSQEKNKTITWQHISVSLTFLPACPGSPASPFSPCRPGWPDRPWRVQWEASVTSVALIKPGIKPWKWDTSLILPSLLYLLPSLVVRIHPVRKWKIKFESRTYYYGNSCSWEKDSSLTGTPSSPFSPRIP